MYTIYFRNSLRLNLYKFNIAKGYLGNNTTSWEEYDSCSLMKKYSSNGDKKIIYDDILVDVGTADTFYINGQLLPEALQTACNDVNQKLTLRFQVCDI